VLSLSTRFLPSDTRFEVPRRGLLDAEPLPSASVSFLMNPVQFFSSPPGMGSGFVKTPKRKVLSARTAGAGKRLRTNGAFALRIVDLCQLLGALVLEIG